jgi:hypothetical protein
MDPTKPVLIQRFEIRTPENLPDDGDPVRKFPKGVKQAGRGHGTETQGPSAIVLKHVKLQTGYVA